MARERRMEILQVVFFDEASRYPQAYPQLPARDREVPRIGRGPPPTPLRHGRAVSFDSRNRRHASGNPLFFDTAVTPTANRTGYPTPRAPQNSQYGLTKSEQIAKVVDAVAEENDMDATFIRDSTHAEYPSDEMSRLATFANLPNDPAWLKNTHILGVLVPAWRAEPKGKGGNGKQCHRVCAGWHSTRIPCFAPYNSGISEEWLEDSKQNPDLALRVADWGTYEELAKCEFKFIPLPA
ncbi:hypothetical protein B0H14DRAFT_3514395 [Mycena olivaceomarginata]|nr:hypothetical protein B0H14DRAFT_3514395 [Mycena olivaceomarginata]